MSALRADTSGKYLGGGLCIGYASEQLEKERRKVYDYVFVDVGALFQAARRHSQNACVKIKRSSPRKM